MTRQWTYVGSSAGLLVLALVVPACGYVFERYFSKMDAHETNGVSSALSVGDDTGRTRKASRYGDATASEGRGVDVIGERWMPRVSPVVVMAAGESALDATVTEREGGGTQVRPRATPWAASGDREGIVLGLDDILRQNGVDCENTRVRMIAHAVVASGWRQKIWHYNAWGVRKGEWQRDWYVMPTVEEDALGNLIEVKDAAWRAFSNWQEAIEDFQQRISPDSTRPAYREAHAYLVHPRRRLGISARYWEALGKGNYYTATWFTGMKFARLCAGVRARLRARMLKSDTARIAS